VNSQHELKGQAM